MVRGQKVVCINDTFSPDVARYYTNLPKKGVMYVIRDVGIGINLKNEPGEICLYLLGLYNPKSNKPPYPERGFSSERFAPLQYDTEINSIEKEDLIEA